MRQLSTTVPFGFEFDERQYLDVFRALGCRWAELYRNVDCSLSAEQALRVADSAGMRFDSVHGVFSWHIDPSSPDPAHRDRCLKIYEDEGRFSLDIGAPVVIVHPSANYRDNRPRAVADADAAQAVRWNTFNDFAARLAAIGERLRVTYLIENVPRNFPFGHDTIGLAERIRQIGSSRLRMCFDVGHAHLTGDLNESLRACADVVSYVHVHDNDGHEDTHWMPGDGTIDWQAFSRTVRDLSLDTPMMLEIFYDLARIRAMISDGIGNRLARYCALTPESTESAEIV